MKGYCGEGGWISYPLSFSNYVARILEDWKKGPGIYNEGAEKYVQIYKYKRLTYEYAVKKIIGNKDNVWSVQFEDFVSSEEYRNEITRKLGLKPENQTKYLHFLPHVSIKNISNYKTYAGQKEIKIIENKLPEYLWEHNSHR